MAEEEIIIRTKDLVKKYGSITAVDHLNLEIRKGEVFGLLGPNGAGKTTTTLMLLGLTDPTAGKAEIAGRDCTRNSLAVKKLVGYLPDNVGFYPDMTGRQNLVFSGMMNGLSRQEAEQRAEGLLERVGMALAADRKTGTYSRGMRQRLGIADVLMKDPQIIIGRADHPHFLPRAVPGPGDLGPRGHLCPRTDDRLREDQRTGGAAAAGGRGVLRGWQPG